MSSKFVALSSALHDYLIAHASPRDPLLDELAEETARLGGVSAMQIAPEQGALMTLLTRRVGARRAIEIGTFTGYSALCIAKGLPEDGTLLCCDVSEEWTAIGRRYFARAGVAHKIDLRIGPALGTLRALPLEPTFDLGFIDADKPNYGAYYEELLPRLFQDVWAAAAEEDAVTAFEQGCGAGAGDQQGGVVRGEGERGGGGGAGA